MKFEEWWSKYLKSGGREHFNICANEESSRAAWNAAKEENKRFEEYAESTLESQTCRIKRLRQLLLEASESIEDWGNYASPYFQEKYNLKDTVKKYREAALDFQEGDA